MLLFPYGEIVFFQDPFKPLEVLFGLSFQPAAAFVCQQFINQNEWRMRASCRFHRQSLPREIDWSKGADPGCQ